jgi:hypothetical protein
MARHEKNENNATTKRSRKAIYQRRLQCVFLAVCTKGLIWLILEMGGSKKFLPYLSQGCIRLMEKVVLRGVRGGGLLLNVNILMKREVFFFPSTNVGVGPV